MCASGRGEEVGGEIDLLDKDRGGGGSHGAT